MIKIQTSGKSKVTVPLIYEELGALDDYALWTKSAGKYGLVGADGKKILDQEYDEINVFSPQTVAVQQNGKTGLMNYKGKIVLPITYESISRVSHAAAWIQKEGKWGLISQEGAILAPPQIDSVYQSNGGIIWVNDLAVIRKEGQLHYLNTKGELLTYSASTADAAARFVKNNLFEYFSIVPGRYAWKTSNAGKIAAGAYILRPTEYNVGYEEAPFPREFSYEAADDWEMEIALSKTGGGQTTGWGFMWGKNTENHTMLAFYGAYLPGSGMGHLDFNVKGGTNTIKFTRIGNVCSFYYNGSLKGTGTLLTKEAGSFWLSMTHSSSGLPCTVYFDSIKFTILDKK